MDDYKIIVEQEHQTVAAHYEVEPKPAEGYQREAIIKDYCTEKDGELYMNSDRLFGSPSSAACFCLGNSSNGWKDWKDKDGKTLDELVRKL